MAVSTLKNSWYKFSAKIRDAIDVVDSYYRPADEHHHPNTDVSRCDKPHHTANNTTKDKHRTNSNNKSNHNHIHQQPSQHHHRQHQHNSSCIVEQTKHCQTSRGQLPLGFSKRKTSQGQVYFVDPNGQKHWYDPSVPKDLLTAPLNLDKLVGRLSSTWEVRQTSSGKTYYVNHFKKTTQFTDPRLIAYKDYLVSVLKQSCTVPIRDESSRSTIEGTSQVGPTLSPLSLNDSRSSGTNRQPLQMCQHHLTPSSCTRPTNNRKDITLSQYDNFNSIQPTNSIGTRPQNDLHTGTLDRRNHALQNRCTRYHRNLLRGSHNNLNVTNSALESGNSNTLTGPLPSWFKPSSRTTTSSARCQSNGQQNLPTTLNNNNSQHPCMNNLSPLYSSITSSGNQTSDGNKELYDKISLLRQELLKQQVLSHPCRIDISRKRIFEESFRVISQLQPRDLKKRLLVKFRGEEGLDYGGVAREWFYLLSREILNPVHGLFQYTSDDIYNLQINPDSGIVYREHLSYLNFCGRVIGMAVFHGHFIEGHFTLPFYKMLLRKPINLEDIENVDPELHRSLCWILENDITNIIDTTFLVQHNAFGQLQEHELKVGGRNIVVNEENKHEYVSLYVNYRCRRGIENQFEALQRGFYELVSPSLVENFDEHELELLIGGLSKINIDDWQLHTRLKNCTADTPLVIWFWDIVKSYSEDRRARLLQFVTGSPRVPIQGFKALQGVNSELRLFTIHLIKNACTDNLPKSHTCFNRIDLPPYETYEKIRDKLTQAIEETMGFAMQ